ncbi:inositol monophosphatase [Rhizophagus irregularis]|uniref:Inositol-1-monophosphatase n=1 Tax=Rhizophagus irregularis TaxID=588596 RepID=A0A2I1GPM9_9GLOM|nr:inositol monophosphatase [Rhizophagus irregularis]
MIEDSITFVTRLKIFPWRQYLEFAISLVQECGQIISEARYSKINKIYEKGENPSDLVTETDKIVEELIKSKLNSKFPDHKFVGEETAAAAGNHHGLTDEPTWIVDPIDGTTNFIHGFPFVAVCIGLTIDKEPVVGAVFNPFLNQLYTARKGNGAYLNLNTKLPLSSPNPPITLPSNLMPKPGDVTWVAKGEADIFWEIGCWEWYGCLVILRESGGLMVNGNGPNEEPANILERKYLAVRGGSPYAGDKTVEQSQLRLVREFWNIVEEIDCPRE